MSLSDTLLLAAVTGVFSAGGAWTAVHYRLKWLERSAARAHRRIDVCETRINKLEGARLS